MTRFSVLTPAKINLGLEVLGRRDDGFHEIRTVLHAISLFDRLELGLTAESRVVTDDFDLFACDNLVEQAMRVFNQGSATPLTAAVLLRKRIPVAAGLGGSSSDAAATLLALERLSGSTGDLEFMAGTLGSDVPFFLSGGAALASGRGERLVALPAAKRVWGVSATPDVSLAGKTGRLYGALIPSDFSDGRRVELLAAKMASGQGLDEMLLGNAFDRPLRALLPEIQGMVDVMRLSGRQAVHVSGAGPTHYSLFDNPAEARHFSLKLRGTLSRNTRIHVWRLIPHGSQFLEVSARPR